MVRRQHDPELKPESLRHPGSLRGARRPPPAGRRAGGGRRAPWVSARRVLTDDTQLSAARHDRRLSGPTIATHRDAVLAEHVVRPPPHTGVPIAEQRPPVRTPLDVGAVPPGPTGSPPVVPSTTGRSGSEEDLGSALSKSSGWLPTRINNTNQWRGMSPQLGEYRPAEAREAEQPYGRLRGARGPPQWRG